MTPEQLAARWLADCTRLDEDGNQPQPGNRYFLLREADALAAIARHLTPGDDLVAQATAALAKLQSQIGDDVQDAYLPEALHKLSADTITALLARLSTLTAEHDRAWQEADAWCGKHAWAVRDKEAAELEAATLRDRLARMEGALRDIADQMTGVVADPANMEIAIHTAASAARAALTESPEAKP